MNAPILHRSNFSDINKVNEFVSWCINEDLELKNLKNPILKNYFDSGIRPTDYFNVKISELNPINILDWIGYRVYYFIKDHSDVKEEDFKVIINNLKEISLIPLETINQFFTHYNIDLQNIDLSPITSENDKFQFIQSTLDENVNFATIHILKKIYSQLFNSEFVYLSTENSCDSNGGISDLFKLIRYFIINIPIIKTKGDIEPLRKEKILDVTAEKSQKLKDLGISIDEYKLPGQLTVFYYYQVNHELYSDFSVDFINNTDSKIPQRLANVRMQMFSKTGINPIFEIYNYSLIELNKLLGDSHSSDSFPLPTNSELDKFWVFEVYGQKYGVFLRMDISNQTNPSVSVWISEIWEY